MQKSIVKGKYITPFQKEAGFFNAGSASNLDALTCVARKSKASFQSTKNMVAYLQRR